MSDHQPANHKEFELSAIGEITEEATVNTGNSKEHCAQVNISEFEDARTQRNSSESDTVRFEGQNEHCAQVNITEFEDARTHKISSDSNTVVIEVIDYTSTPVTGYTRYDQRAIDVGGCNPTTRIMVPGRVDR